MKHIVSVALSMGLLIGTVTPTVSASLLPQETLSAVVLVMSMDDSGDIVQFGSGTHYGEDLILTNAHVIVDDNEELVSEVAIAFTIDPKKPPRCITYTDVLAYDNDLDLALLAFKSDERNECETSDGLVGKHALSPIDIRGDSLFASEVPDISEEITIVGYPELGLGSVTVTRGIVSGYFYDDADNIEAIQTDAEVGLGNSGGAAFDENGYFIGVPSFVITEETALSKNNGVISLNVINNWFDDLEREGYIEYTDTADEDCFSDVPLSHPNATAICSLAEEGVLTGYSDGTFKPYATVNRAELLKILIYGGLGIEPSSSDYAACFPDVQYEWFAPYVCYAKELGIVDGYSDGYFRPAQTVNVVEALKMALNALDVPVPQTVSAPRYSDVPTNAWFAGYAQVAYDLKLIDAAQGLLYPAQGMSRGSISEVVYRLLTIDKDDTNYYGQGNDYVDHTLKIRIGNPLQWEREAGDELTETSFLSPDEFAAISFVTEKLDFPMDSASYWQQALPTLQESFENFTLLSVENTNADGFPAIDTIYTADMFGTGNGTYKVLQRVFVGDPDDSIAYVLSYVSLEEDFELHKQSALQLFNSFEFLP